MIEKEDILSNLIKENLSEIPSTINKKTSKNNVKFEYREEYYQIKQIIDNYIDKEETHKRFLVLPGIRGVGKTTLLYQIYEYLFKEKNIPINQILYLTCDDIDDITECNLREIIELYLKNHHQITPRMLEKKIFLLIDEAQYDRNWARIGKILFDKTENILMIFTGSSALNLEDNADAKRRFKKILIPPISYEQHIKLKYNIDFENNSEDFKNLLNTGNIEEIEKREFFTKTLLSNNVEYTENDWRRYVLYGGYPVNYNETDISDIKDNLVEIVEKVIDIDLKKIKSMSDENKANSNRTIRYLALQSSNDTSMDKIANYLKTSTSNVKTILDCLEKTQIIFHCEPYGSSSKRTRKSWKYYFATSSLKNALVSSMGNPNKIISQYEGILLENMVAGKLHQFITYNKEYTLHYDSNKKGNVDFILHKDFRKPVPIEVGRGKKDKKQIKEAMNHYKSEYGIIVSNKTEKIESEDNVIYIPPKSFALL